MQQPSDGSQEGFSVAIEEAPTFTQTVDDKRVGGKGEDDGGVC